MYTALSSLEMSVEDKISH